MEIAKVKITNEVMTEICETIFWKDDSYNTKLYSDIVLPIKPEIIDLFFTHQYELQKRITYPYISLTSDNASNRLQIYIGGYEYGSSVKIVTVGDIQVKTRFCYKDGNIYSFIN